MKIDKIIEILIKNTHVEKNGLIFFSWSPPYVFCEVKRGFVEGVVEKHDFRGIQRKIPQISDFCSKA
jgi:hypothetical protein